MLKRLARRVWSRKPLLGFLALVIAVIVAFGGEAHIIDHQHHEDRAAAMAAERSAYDSSLQTYSLCQAVNSNRSTLKAVLDTAYSQGASHLDPADLTPAARRVIAFLAPLSRLTAHLSAAAKRAVEALLHKPKKCARPAKPKSFDR